MQKASEEVILQTNHHLKLMEIIIQHRENIGFFYWFWFLEICYLHNYTSMQKLAYFTIVPQHLSEHWHFMWVGGKDDYLHSHTREVRHGSKLHNIAGASATGSGNHPALPLRNVLGTRRTATLIKQSHCYPFGPESGNFSKSGKTAWINKFLDLQWVISAEELNKDGSLRCFAC